MTGKVYLGIFEGHYDPAVAAVRDGEVLAFAEEERFLRNKHAKGSYPERALKFCLDRAGVGPQDVAAIGINWNLKSYTDGSMSAFFSRMRKEWPAVDGRTVAWQNRVTQIYNESTTRERHQFAWRRAFGEVTLPPLHGIPHHYTHALQAYLQSPFEEALCLTVDGSGDQHCSVLWRCEGERIEPFYEINMPHSLGWFYAAFTEYLGFEAYDGEYKVMGLAAYGKANADLQGKIGRILKAAPDAIGYRLDPTFIHYGAHSWSERFTDEMPKLFERNPRAPDETIEEWHFDLAFAVQAALEGAVTRLVSRAANATGLRNLCIGGGVGLNVKMNSELFALDGIDRVFAHPLCSDSGAAAGAALGACWRETGVKPEALRTLALGNEESEGTIEATLKRCGVRYERPGDIAGAAAKELAAGNVVGWFQGRMEAGPRALGQRSILADPRKVESRDRVNAVIKYREPWRPFCPSMTAEAAERYLVDWDDAPFMIIAFRANERMKSEAPAVVHVDGTARVQLVHRTTHALYHRLISSFEKITGVPVLLNTSFNVKGEPIVCTATDALRTFFATGMDCLAIGPFLLKKVWT